MTDKSKEKKNFSVEWQKKNPEKMKEYARRYKESGKKNATLRKAYRENPKKFYERTKHHTMLWQKRAFEEKRFVEIGMLLKKYRLGLGSTQAELADLCNVSLSSYRKWEYGVTKPKKEKFLEICDIFYLSEEKDKILEAYYSK